MSGVWGWFGGGAAAKKKDTPKNAILDLRAQLDMLQKREKHLMNQMDEMDAVARKNINTNKNAAKAALRRKKGHETSLEQVAASIVTLEQQINAIESANINRETLAVLDRASQAMKQIHGKLTVEQVDETMEKLRQQTDISNEIIEAIKSNSEDMDAEDLERELEQLQQEVLDDQMIKSGTVPVSVSSNIHKLPSVTNSDIKSHAQAEEEEEAELRKLQAEMAM